MERPGWLWSLSKKGFGRVDCAVTLGNKQKERRVAKMSFMSGIVFLKATFLIMCSSRNYNWRDKKDSLLLSLTEFWHLEVFPWILCWIYAWTLTEPSWLSKLNSFHFSHGCIFRHVLNLVAASLSLLKKLIPTAWWLHLQVLQCSGQCAVLICPEGSTLVSFKQSNFSASTAVCSKLHTRLCRDFLSPGLSTCHTSSVVLKEQLSAVVLVPHYAVFSMMFSNKPLDLYWN